MNTAECRTSIEALLAKVPDALVKRNTAGSACTTFAVGGPIEYLVEPHSEQAVAELLKTLSSEDRPYVILGSGSNVVIPDKGIGGIVIRLGKGLRYRKSLSETRFEVGAAMSLMTLSRELSEAGLAGIEFAGGIPASIGGAVRMNAGAHGDEIASLLRSVTIVTRDGRIESLSPAEVGFSYRHSNFPAGSIVVRAELELTSSDRQTTAARRSEFLAERKRRQPLTLPSAGSVFKNPAGTLSAGALLEAAGMKGERIGGAQVSILHANWIVNDERSASASDISALVKLCKERVLAKDGISLEPEILLW